MVALKNLKTRAKMYAKVFMRLVSNTFRPFAPADRQRTIGGLGIARGDTALAVWFSLLGGYLRAGYPNWATKCLLDALLRQHRLEHLARK